VMEQELKMEMTRTVERATFEGMDVWRITDAIEMPAQAGGGTGLDRFDVEPNTLWPVQRDMQGQGTIRVHYTDSTITGEMNLGMGATPVNVDLEAPVLGDGPGLVLWLAGMPLAEGYQTTVRNFDPLTQRVRAFTMSVTGTEPMEVPAGTFETFVVTFDPLDGDPSGAATLHVMKEAPHYVVQGEFKLPAIMGGGTLSTTLTSR